MSCCPKSMTFVAGAESVFQPIQQDPNIQTFVAKNATPGKALEFTVSGTGSMPREAQNGPQATSRSGRRWRTRQPARRRPRHSHQHARSAQQVQVVDSWRTRTSSHHRRSLPVTQARWSACSTSCACSRHSLTLNCHARIHLLFNSGCKEQRIAQRIEGRALSLESEKLSGTLSPEEYAEVKPALEVVLKRALKRNS